MQAWFGWETPALWKLALSKYPENSFLMADFPSLSLRIQDGFFSGHDKSTGMGKKCLGCEFFRCKNILSMLYKINSERYVFP
jgi:hypothetical protein